MRIINKWAMSSTAGVLLLAIPIASYYIVKHNLKGKRLAKQAHAAHKADILPAFTATACACCGGTATRLYSPYGDPEQIICADRNLCRATMIYTAMLKNVQSA